MDIEKTAGFSDSFRINNTPAGKVTDPQEGIAPVDDRVVANIGDPSGSLKMKDLQAATNSQPEATPQKANLEEALGDLFSRAEKSNNPVVASLEPLVRNSRFVKIDFEKIKEWAEKLTSRDLQSANWKFPHYIEEDSAKTIDFFMLANSINFMFFDPSTGDKYKTEYRGKELSGADAMVGAIKRAMEEGIPILDAGYLSTITSKDMRHIFRGNMEIPLLKERTKIFREVGRVLNRKYDGHFSNLAQAAGYKAFDNGNGIVERLTRDFPSFRDESVQQETGENLLFNKRAQLAVGMLHSRLQGTGLFDCPDAGDLTVFADYQLPKGLRSMGILKYDKELADIVDNRHCIEKDSPMEQELRGNTVIAAKLLEYALNRREDIRTDARGIDFLLWWNARQDKVSNHHMTVTTAY